MTGVRMALIRIQNRIPSGSGRASSGRSAIARMSAPAAKNLSVPARTMQRTSGSASRRSSVSAISARICGERALRASGRFSRTRPTRNSSTETSTCATALLCLQGRHRVLAGGGAPDDQLLDLRGPLVQRRHPGVAQVTLDRVVVDVAGAAVDLDRQVRALDRRLRRVQLRDRGLGRVRLLFILEQAGAEDQHPGGIAAQDHFGDHLLDQLETGQGDAELLAFLGVFDRALDAAFADADAAGGDAVAAVFERAHRDLEAVADLAEHRVVADLDLVEGDFCGIGGAQPELAVDLLGGEAVAAGRDDEAGEAAMLLLRVGLGEDQGEVGDVAEADPHLLAADRPAVLGLGRAGALVGGVGAGVGLGQAEAAEPLAGAESRQPLLFLLLGAPLLDRASHEGGADGDHRASGGIGAADLLGDQPVADVVEAAAAVLFGDRGAEEADFPELARQLAVEAAGTVVLARRRQDLPLSELARGFANQLLLVAQLEVHGPPFLARLALKARVALYPASPRRHPGPHGCADRERRRSCGRRRRRRPGSRAWSRRGRPRRRSAGPPRPTCPLPPAAP